MTCPIAFLCRAVLAVPTSPFFVLQRVLSLVLDTPKLSSGRCAGSCEETCEVPIRKLCKSLSFAVTLCPGIGAAKASCTQAYSSNAGSCTVLLRRHSSNVFRASLFLE